MTLIFRWWRNCRIRAVSLSVCWRSVIVRFVKLRLENAHIKPKYSKYYNAKGVSKSAKALPVAGFTVLISDSQWKIQHYLFFVKGLMPGWLQVDSEGLQ